MANGHGTRHSASEAAAEASTRPWAETGSLEIPSHGTYRNLAISAGDLRAAVLSEVNRLLKQNGGNPLDALKTGLVRLQGQGMIKTDEVELLGKVCEAVYAAQTGKRNRDEAFSEIRMIYQALIVKLDASPFALVVASVAAGAQPVFGDTEQPASAVTPAASRSNTIDAGLLGGIIAGGIIGGAFGGVVGGIIGGVVGGVAGGIGAACATS
jgi:hypothetical protein